MWRYDPVVFTDEVDTAAHVAGFARLARALRGTVDEVVLSVFLGGPAATTLPKRMWDNVRHEIDPTITAVASILIAGSIVVLALAELLASRGRRELSSRRP